MNPKAHILAVLRGGSGRGMIVTTLRTEVEVRMRVRLGDVDWQTVLTTLLQDKLIAHKGTNELTGDDLYAITAKGIKALS
jgi:hypothetical protein